MTVPRAQGTGAALQAEVPMETVIVTLPPPPRPEREGGRRGGISQTTEHLLIAAGSIGKLGLEYTRIHANCSE